ncbi:cadherin domain-containing protein [Nocardioides jishulii]|uniref:Cadherin domain-containing protein n=1 Tax=Nocardioides jishulii TaxID=2575440 RepID=A0A4U2YK14_9ACTN|nr:cadherin domain-containing protein [Nocardioides jishulii]QCX26987.1 hypothetical protein FCL41_05175 [Nocardioides jishulii]TKI61469.1 hypothetical protein FC770_11810 [Nocardioides jishulii]
MPEHRSSSSSQHRLAPLVLVAMLLSAFAVVPTPGVEAAVPVVESSVALDPRPAYGPGRLKNATPMTQGCIVKGSRVVKHLKKGAKCAPGSTKVEFKVKNPTQLCLMPRGVLKSFRSFRTCDARGGFSQRGLANNKTLFCAVPGKQVRWAPKPKKCVRPERSWTLRNHHPVSLTLGGGVIDENAGKDAVVGTLNTVDIDPGDIQRYSLVAGAGSTHNSLFRIADGRLLARADLDHEAGDLLRVRVLVRDFRRGRLVRPFTVTVADVNEAPRDLALDGTEVAENAPVGTRVGTLSASDPDRGDALTYALDGSALDNADFEVDGNRLLTAVSFDHEVTPQRSVRLVVTDRASLTETQDVTIDVTDVNEAPTSVALSRDIVVENAAADTLVGAFEVTDPDAGAPYTFRILPGADGDDFGVRGDQLVSSRPLDHEEKDTRTVRVEVTDSEGVTLAGSVRVHVIDVNEAPTALATDGDTVEENAPAGTLVSTLTGTDPDRGDTLAYALTTGAGDGGNSFFEVVDDELRVKRPLDHEAAATRSVRLAVTDAGGLTFERTLTVTVDDVNEAPTGLRISKDDVNENVPLGTVVGRLDADDEDADDTQTFTLVAGTGDADNSFFAVDGATLVTARALDHEAAETRSVRLRVTDSAGAAAERAVTITVNDLNDGPRDLALDRDEVEENSAVGTVVGRFSASDEDDADALTYALVAGAGDGGNGRFDIDGDELVVKASLDHETAASHSIRVRVADGAGEQVARTFTVTVLDVNEAPTALALDHDEIDENVTGTVGELSAADVDAGDALTFALVGGAGDTHNADFEVVGDELRTKAGLDFEAGATRSVRVEVSDRGGLTSTKVLEVTVNDVNEAPGLPALDNDDVDENAVDALVGTLSAVDPDARTTLDFSLVAGAGDADNGLFAVVGDELRTRGGLDFEAAGTRSVRVLVSDGTLTASRQLTVTVNDRNDAPTGIALTPSTVDENAADTVVGALGADDQDGDTLTWTLVSGAGDADNAAFVVDGDELKTRAGLDFEAGAERAVRVEAHDGTVRVERALTVTVDDVNEVPSLVTLDSLTVAEDTADARVGGLAADDPDGDPLTYTFVTGAGDADNNNLFTISNGTLRTKAGGVDFEAKATRSVRIAASDGSLTGAGTSFTVSVVDRNDAPTAITLDPTRIRLDAEVGDVVGTLAAADVDATKAHAFTDVSVAGTHSGHGLFTIDGDEVKVARSLTGLSTGSVDLRVRVDDAWAADRTQDASLIRTVRIDLLSARSVALDSMTVDENAPAGTRVGALTYTDPMTAGPYTFVLVPGARDNDDFQVTAGNELRTLSVLDHESTPTRTVEVQVFAGGSALFAAALDVTVADVNEAPVGLALSSTTVAENVVDASVGTLSASDPDAGAFLTYALVAGAGDTHNAQFAIAGSTLRTVGALDFEAGPTRQVRVAVSDGTLTQERTFTVVLLDRNDAPTAIALSDATVLDSAAPGDAVGTLSATDVDATKPHAFTEVPGGNHSGLLTVAGGQVRVAGDLLGVSGDKTVKVRVTDTWGGVTHTYEQLLTVTVSQDSRGTLALSGDSIAENSPSGTAVGELVFSGVGAGPYTYQVVAPADFAVAGSTVRSARTFDHETRDEYVVQVRVTDAGGRQWLREVTVEITDVNEPPFYSHGSNQSLEGVSNGIRPEAVDPEGTPLTWTFETCDGFVDDNARFTLDATTGEAIFSPGLDFEDPTRNEMRLCLGFTDGVHLVKHSWTLAAIDVNEPTTDITLSSTVVDPAVAVGTVVGTLTAVDPDARKPAITDVSTTESGAGYFTVVGDELRVARDLSTLGVFELQVTLLAADSWTTGPGPAVAQSYRKTLTIQLKQPLDLSAPDGSVNENQSAGTRVSTLVASGGTAPHTYALDGAGEDNALFQVVGNELQTKRALDFEVDGSTLTARVAVTDADGDTVSRTVEIVVGDVNEQSLWFTMPTPTTVYADAPVGNGLGYISVSDPDARKPELSVTGINALYFRFDGEQLVVADDLSALPPGVRTIPFKAHDTWGTPPVSQELSGSYSVQVVATPTLDAPDGAIAEGLPAGTRVSTLTAAGGRTPYTYALDGTSVNGSDNDLFAVVGNEVQTRGPLDFDTQPSLTVKVKVTDAWGRVVRRTVTVTVTDVVYGPVTTSDTVTGVVGNTRKVVSDSVLANDTDPEDKVGPQDSLSAVAGTLTTTRGGTVTMASDGTFTYDPKAGDRALTDTVVYTVRSSASGLTSTATLSLEIGQRLVWYVDDSASAGGNGTSQSYFNAIASVPQVPAGHAADEVYLADGTYGAVTINRGRTLRGAQAGLPGLIAAVPSDLAQISVSGSTTAVVIDGGGTVEGVRVRAVNGAAVSIRNSGAVTVTSASRIEGASVGVEVQGTATGLSGDLVLAAPITMSAGEALKATARSGGSLTVDGEITGGSVTLAQLGGPVTFNRDVTGPSVSLNGNSGVTTFAGRVTLNRAGGQPALTATGGGTLTMGAAGNTVRGPVNVDSVTIGAGGLKLDSLNVPSTVTGYGLRLRGVQGQPVVVQGTGTAGSGGTLTAATPVVTDGRVSLELNRVNLVSTGQRGIHATGLAGPLKVLSSTVTGATGDAVLVTGAAEGADLQLRSSTVSGAGDSGVVVTATSGNASVLVDSSTVTGSGTTGSARDGVRVESLGSAQVVTTVTGSTFADNKGDQVQVVGRGSGTSRATITGNTLARTGSTGSGQGIVVNGGGSAWRGAKLLFDVSGNQIQRVDGAGIVLTANGPTDLPPSGAVLEGRAINNTFGSGGACAGAPAVLVDAEGSVTVTALVSGNTGSACGLPFRAIGARGGSVLNLTAVSNALTGTGAAEVRSGVAGVPTSGTTCFDARANQGGIDLSAVGGALALPGFGGDWTSSGVSSYLAYRNGMSIIRALTAARTVTDACVQPVL